MERTLKSATLTVVISDLNDFINAQEPVKKRTVKVPLLAMQRDKIGLWHNDEQISECFLEDVTFYPDEQK